MNTTNKTALSDAEIEDKWQAMRSAWEENDYSYVEHEVFIAGYRSAVLEAAKADTPTECVELIDDILVKVMDTGWAEPLTPRRLLFAGTKLFLMAAGDAPTSQPDEAQGSEPKGVSVRQWARGTEGMYEAVGGDWVLWQEHVAALATPPAPTSQPETAGPHDWEFRLGAFHCNNCGAISANGQENACRFAAPPVSEAAPSEPSALLEELGKHLPYGTTAGELWRKLKAALATPAQAAPSDMVREALIDAVGKACAAYFEGPPDNTAVEEAMIALRYKYRAANALAATPVATHQAEPVALGESALMKLARRCLWIAYCWNDHNLKDSACEYAKREAEALGIKSFEDTNDWLVAPPAQSAAPGEARDAARYRWLRHGDNDELVLKVHDEGKSRAFDNRFDAFFLPRLNELDAAIDAAFASSGRKTE